MPAWSDVRYEDIKHLLDSRMRELHERLIAEIEALAMSRHGLTHEEYERRVDAHFVRSHRERAAGGR